MALNGEQAEQIRRADIELAIKKRLEVSFRGDLKRLFRRIGGDLGETLATSGGTVSSAAYTNDVRIILNKHYSRVQRRFSKEIIQFLRRNPKDQVVKDLKKLAELQGISTSKLIKRMKISIDNDLISFREVNVAQSMSVITETTQREIDRAVSKAETSLTEEIGKPPTNGQLAKKSRRDFIKRQNSRAAMIAVTETQKASEATKQIERDNMSLFRNNSAAAELELPELSLEPVWVTQGDSLVRAGDGSIFNHLAADGQRRKNGIFIVSGQSLRTPGDTSLGASAGNVIRCRCSAVTVIQG